MADPNLSQNSRRNFPDWQNEFQAALLEDDPKKLPQAVEAAEAAIFFRLQALTHSSSGHVERDAIADAMRTLPAIKAKKM
jgi:hypothetical protein